MFIRKPSTEGDNIVAEIEDSEKNLVFTLRTGQQFQYLSGGVYRVHEIYWTADRVAVDRVRDDGTVKTGFDERFYWHIDSLLLTPSRWVLAADGVWTYPPNDLKNTVAVVDGVTWSCNHKKHMLRYGLQVMEFSNKRADLDAAAEFGRCVRHQAECEGVFDEG